MSEINRDTWEAVIGVEIHAQLMTASKIFSPAPVAFGEEPNSQVNEICAGLPGVLPVLNRKAVELALRAGCALQCRIHRWSQFARKNYFYPDLPKGYQISQFDHPLCEGGCLDIEGKGWEKRVGITRIHMEEDSGKSFHEGESAASRIDLNRAGTGLIEIVSEPDMRSGEEAAAYFRELRAILVAIGVNDGNLAEASMRCDANISVRPRGDAELGTKVEVKNLNSFKFVKDAIDFEIDRQLAAIAKGEEIHQETRLWNETRRETALLRRKQGSADYRYFPEPDLPPLVVTDEEIARVREELPELPAAQRMRLREELGLSAYDAGVLVGGDGFVAFLDAGVKAGASAKGMANWITGSLAAALNAGEARRDGGEFVSSDGHVVTPESVAALQGLVDSGDISTTIARDVWLSMLSTGRTPSRIVEEDGLRQVSDTSVLEEMIDRVLADHPKEVETYRGGKQGLLGFFVGQVMKASRGKADPASVNKLLREKLEEGGE